ncbi:STAS domain-containing protein, partial [Acinetobacter baumannii]
DPQQVTLDCRHLRLADHSAIAAVQTLAERYVRAGQELRVVALSQRCSQLLERAGLPQVA